MNSTSYMFSFVLGLIVVIVFLVVLNSRFHFVNNLFQQNRGNSVAIVTPSPEVSVTPSVAPKPTTVARAQTRPTVAPTRVPTTAPRQNNSGRVLGQTSPTAQARRPTAVPQPTLVAQNATRIPNTGFPTLMLGLIPAGLFAGIRLRKTS